MTKKNKFMLCAGFIGLSMLMLEKLSNFYLLMPLGYRIIEYGVSILVIILSFLRKDILFYILAILSPIFLWDGISVIYTNLNGLIFNPPAFFKIYIYKLDALAIMLAILLMSLAFLSIYYLFSDNRKQFNKNEKANA